MGCLVMFHLGCLHLTSFQTCRPGYELHGKRDLSQTGSADDPDDVGRAERTPPSGHDAVSPQEGVPLGGTAVWCEATLPAKEGTPSSAMPVLRRSNMVVSDLSGSSALIFSDQRLLSKGTLEVRPGFPFMCF